jgi:hypothetical protein
MPKDREPRSGHVGSTASLATCHRCRMRSPPRLRRRFDSEILLIEAKRSAGHGPVGPPAYDLMLRAVPLIG